MNLLLATTNPGKLAEVTEFLKGLPVTIIPLSGLKDRPEIIEDGRTFEENALKKARALADFSGYATLADDSGIVVDALGGAPGVFSARYGGVEGDDARNNEKLLQALEGVAEEKRGARFVCVLALCTPNAERREWLFRGQCEGRIALAPRGENGFGYDPIFFYPPLGKTFGEIDRATKEKFSHRGDALRKLAAALPSILVHLEDSSAC